MDDRRRNGRPRADVARTDPPNGPREYDAPRGNARLAAPERRTRRAGTYDSPGGTAEADERVRHIDETLTRMTAAHAGLALISDGGEDDEPPAPRRRRVTPVRVLGAALALAVLAAAGLGAGTRSWLAAAVPTVAALDPGSSAIQDAAAQTGATNVLVVAGEQGAAAAGATTFAIAHVPKGGGPLTVLSIPAQLQVDRPACETYDPISKEYVGAPKPAEPGAQLSAALGVGGPRCLTRVVQQLTGMAVTGYLGVDVDKLGTLVQTVGGVTVCVGRPVDDAALGPILQQAGAQQLPAAKAGDFLRAAAVDGDQRTALPEIQRQQSVLAGVLAPLLSTTGLLDVGRVSAARQGVGDTLTTDALSLDQVLATADSLRRMDAQSVTTATVPTVAAGGSEGITLDGGAASALFAALRTDKPLPSSADAAAAAPKPSDATVAVVNATDRTGLAAKVSGTLKSLGFGVGESSTAAQGAQQTVIRFSPDQAQAADMLAATVPSATKAPDPGATGVLQLVLGRSYDDVLRAPTAADTGQAAATTAAVPEATCP